MVGLKNMVEEPLNGIELKSWYPATVTARSSGAMAPVAGEPSSATFTTPRGFDSTYII